MQVSTMPQGQHTTAVPASMVASPSPSSASIDWNMLSDVLFPPVLTDGRFSLDCPEEEVWIPSDQTLHWGKRPYYIYPTLKLNRKDEIASVPRGSRLVAKLWFCEWAWDDEKPLGGNTATATQNGQAASSNHHMVHSNPTVNSSNATANNNASLSASLANGIPASLHGVPLPGSGNNNTTTIANNSIIMNEEATRRSNRPDPSSTPCFEDEKTMIPFEKNMAVFRHLRISKNIKLKKTETFTITGLGFEIGYHNPFTKTPFKSLDIFLSKSVRIHIVAHKGSVKLMQKHGLLPATLNPNGITIPPHLTLSSNGQKATTTAAAAASSSAAAVASSSSSMLLQMMSDEDGPMSEEASSGEENSPNSPSAAAAAVAAANGGLKRSLSQHQQQASSSPSSNAATTMGETWGEVMMMMKKKAKTTNNTSPTMTQHQQTSQIGEVLDELSSMQQQIDSLKKKVFDLMMFSSNSNQNTTTTIINTTTTNSNITATTPSSSSSIIQQQQQSIIESSSSSINSNNNNNITTTTVSIPKPVSRTVRIPCSSDRIRPNAFIYYAFRMGDLELGVALIKTFQFNINERNSNGYTILHIAARHAFPEGVAWCLQNGAAVNAYTNLRCTPLHLAYLRNDKTVRKILKEHKADTEAVNVWGLKPRDYRNNRRPIMRPIPEAAHSVEVLLEGFDHPFEIRVWFTSRIGWLEVLKMYIEQLGCDVDVKNSNGQTPLMCACEHRQEAVVRYLLAMGSDVNARDIHDATPLHYAYMSFDQNRAILEMLEQAGADPTVKNIYNRTPAWYRNKSLDNHWNPIWNL